MGPIVKELASVYADKSIRFVTFDFTSDETKKAGQAAAKELGVSELYAETAPMTGFLLLYDTKTKKVIGKLNAGDEAAKWRAAIDSGLDGPG